MWHIWHRVPSQGGICTYVGSLCWESFSPHPTLTIPTPFNGLRQLSFRAQLKCSLGTLNFPIVIFITLAINYLCH